MALENLISVQFTQQELQQLDAALSAIENILQGKVINLTPQERMQYGRINNETAHWIEKVKGYMEQEPNLVPVWLDKPEFNSDHGARASIQPLLNRLASIHESLDDTNMLLSSDVYHAAIAFYRNIKNAANENVPGTTSIYQDLARQFPGRPSGISNEGPSDSPQGPQSPQSGV